MAILVPTRYNASVAGMAAGVVAATANTSSTAATFVNVQNAAVVFGTALDAAIGADATLASGGATIVPATAAQANAAVSRPAALQAICFAYFASRPLTGNTTTDTTASTYTTAVASVAAQYAEFLAVGINNS